MWAALLLSAEIPSPCTGTGPHTLNRGVNLSALCGVRHKEQASSAATKRAERGDLICRLLQEMVDGLSPSGDDALMLLGDDISPIKHLHLVSGSGNRDEDDATLHVICDKVLADAGCALVVSDYSPLEKNAPRPSIRLAITSGHTQEQLEACAAAIGKAAALVFNAVAQ